MKPLTKLILAIIIVALSVVSVVLFVVNRQSIVLAVYNPITDTFWQKKVSSGDILNDYLSERKMNGYEFMGYYYNNKFNKKVDMNQSITQNLTLIEGYCQEITEISQARDCIVGVKFVGELSDDTLKSLLKKNIIIGFLIIFIQASLILP